jgi:hypothetical protein
VTEADVDSYLIHLELKHKSRSGKPSKRERKKDPRSVCDKWQVIRGCGECSKIEAIVT